MFRYKKALRRHLREDTVAAIEKPDADIAAAAHRRLAEQARPAGSPGLLEPAATRILFDIKTFNAIAIENAQTG